MKVTIYTVSDCKFSQAEKDYLQSKNITFEEKNLESNREYLTEMLNLSNNFAGTPVTKIEKDDGQVTILKGFTKEEFDNALSTQPSTPQSTTSTPTTPADEVSLPPLPVQDPVPLTNATMPPPSGQPDMMSSSTEVKPSAMPTDQPADNSTNPLIAKYTSATPAPAVNTSMGMAQDTAASGTPPVEPITPPTPQETPTSQNPMSSVMDNLQSKAESDSAKTTADVVKPTS